MCDSFTGQCLCKENVQGSRCDQCRVGTFHLDPTNPKGCTSCFCFGATDRCRSSDKRRTEIMNMEGWVLLGADRQEVPVSVYPGQDLVEADLTDVPDIYQDLHWIAPKTYLGDKVSSYGGSLRYRLHTQTMRGDALLPAESSRPDVILKGNKMTLVFMEREYPSAEDPHHGIVHIVEGSFRHAQTGNAVSREELMMVLVSLESLHIRALHSQSAHSVSLRGAVLEGAQNLPTGRHANNVEICMCPANYQGDSCQKCAPGYYRDTIGLFLGKCVPCNCNGHSDQCLDGSGVCVNCRHNTAGEHCEKCLGGFMGNNTLDGHSVSCSSCPCPLSVPSNNFAEGCVQKNDRMQCLCMPGYAGPNCERCAPGHYGNPMVIGSRCKPCHCNGNTDSNMLFTDCHPLTGECLGCMHHTAGPHCEVCAHGYHGDAIHAKNCTKCSCSPCGTESCDPHTGQCRCKPGVTGPLCDRCQDGAFGFNSCSGCRPCDCEASAALVQPCDPLTGACSCQPGVNGPNCKQCAPGHWDYGPNGCKKCNCRGGRCDPRSGECRCPDGMTGKQCDSCSSKYSVPVEEHHSMHCLPCDSCVVVLLEDLERMSENFTSVSAQLRNLNASSIAWAQLNSLNKTMADIARSMGNNSTVDENRDRANLLEAEVANIDSDIDELQDKASAMSARAGNLDDSSNSTHQRAEDLLSFINNMTMDINDILLTANRSLNSTEEEQDEDERARMLNQVQAMLREMRFRSCSRQKNMAEREKTQAEKLLERVFEEIANRHLENENSTLRIKEQLNKFNSMMMDLRDALNEAVNNTARAEEINTNNEKAIDDHLRRVQDLLSNEKEVNDQLQMAEDNIATVNDLLSMLQDSKEEYERLAAQLDGARTPLAKKVDSFAWTESKIPLVEQAEKHAEMLNELAMNISDLVEDTKKDGFVDVTQAYNKIINSIKEAEDAADKADKAATNALENVKNQDLGQIADSLKNHSMELKEEVEKLDDELNNELNPQLEEAKERLDEAKDKQKNVTMELEKILNNLNFTTNVSKEIQEAKDMAEKANTTATEVHNALRPIKEQLDKWQDTYGDVNATNTDINNALTEANNTVNMLGDTVPLLLKKLDKLQNHSAQMPNISESINRIRELIQQARNAASKVGVPVKFNGKSGVQVRNPSNLADLAAYTNLKFYITLPESATRKRRQDELNKQFVFYLGNKDSSKEFLGMALEGKRLRWYFNIGGETAEVQMAEDVKSDGNFNRVVLERILQYGQMAMSSEATEGDQRVTKAYVEAGGDQGLLSLLTDDTVFYVGGYPSSFKPPAPLALPNFKGCIELDTLNEEVLSLYNFEKTFELNTTQDRPCGRLKPLLAQPWVNDAAYFDGTGFAQISFSDEVPRMQRFEQEVKLVSHHGILLLLLHQSQFLCLAVQKGLLKVLYNFNGKLNELTPKEPNSPFLKISDGDAKALEIIILRSSPNRVVVRNSRNTLYNEVFGESIPPFTTSYYLGGVPDDKMPEPLKAMFPKQGSLKGCFRNVKALNSHIDLKRMISTGVSFGCDSDLLVAREAHFSGQSYLDLDLTNVPSLRNNFYTSFSFRTEQKDGLMFYHRDSEGLCQVFLNEGYVVVRAGNSELKTQKTYNDDNTHYIALYNNINGMRLYMDDVLEKSKEGISVSRVPAAAASLGTTYLGGTPDQGLTNLTGCISNVFIKRDVSPQMVLDLLKAKENINVPMKCPAAKKPQQIKAAASKPSKPKGKKKPAGSRSRNTRDSCRSEISDPEPGATHFSGSTHSFQKYDALNLNTMLHISLALRINSSEGLVLHAAGGRRSKALMSLSVSDGHLQLLLDGSKKKITLRSRKKYNDDQWHTVFVKREGEKMTLVVDGISAQSKRIPGGDKTKLSGPLYIGGLPPTLSAPGSSGFVGCVRDLKLNDSPAGRPSQSQGTVPCFQQPLQPGVYFSGQGGHITIEETLVLEEDFHIELEVRPVSYSGLLLHAGISANHYLTVVLNQGEVMVWMNSGEGDVSTSFSPEEPLCNGHWHTLTVMRRNKVLTLWVDVEPEQSLGPKQSSSPGAKQTVYLGGVPGGVVVPNLPESLSAFHGCVRSASVNDRAAVLSKPLSVHGAVGTQGCPKV